MREGGLHTVCEEARCPNIGECWGRGTATFQIMGDVCTRACRYCAVTSGRPETAPEPLEPLRVARTVQRMGLRHVVVTSVDRDDLPDRGAGHFAATIRAIRRANPDCGIEVLVPDFLGFREQSLRTVLEAAPDVFNHNIETAERLYRRVRPKGDYRKALDLLDRAKDVWAALHPARPPLLTKAGIIVGMGESDDGRRGGDARPARAPGRRGHHRAVPAADRAPPAARPLGHAAAVPPVPRAGRGDGLRLGLRRAAGALELPRRGAAARRRGRIAGGRALIRAARPDEGEVLRRIAVEAKGFWGYPPARVEEWAAGLDLSPARMKHSETAVAEAGGRVIGWTEVLPPTAGVSILEHLWVEPGSMRAGVGSRLFRHAGDRARALGAAVMEWEAEPNALGFYARMGGRPVRTATSEWGRELTVMAVDLD